eukprot:CAMPEP_0119357330 /NCGR_PEP_ID=MMETSP1334-20130426/5741_1 /TAXON_ID=127549 /ORGANISM="Calcidiscus leptoporus, Strain RCC1130" /LENGTH=37 /DNA_ID= /DNA_START= /DNA_END= /DNA_ORIENTATION=
MNWLLERCACTSDALTNVMGELRPRPPPPIPASEKDL